MSEEHGITPETLKRQRAVDIDKARTFATHGLSRDAAKAYLETPNGALYWLRVAEADPNPNVTVEDIDRRVIDHLTSGRDLPQMVTIGPDEPLVKVVPRGESATPYTPFFGKRPDFERTVAQRDAIHDRFGLPIRNEAPVYDLVEMRATLPTEVFVSTVAPTSELDGLVTHDGGAIQYLVPNRKLFTEPVRIASIGNDLSLHNDLVVGKGLGAPLFADAESASRGLARGVGVLGAAAVAWDATTTAAHASDLLHDGNTVGAESEIEHFGARNLGALGGAVLGAEVAGTAGAETGPFDLVIAGVGGIVGAVGGEALANWYDQHQIDNQDGPEGITWHYDPEHPQNGWTRSVADSFIDRALGDTHVEQAPPALSERLTFQANNIAVGLALGHTPPPRDPYTQPSTLKDTPSHRPAPWTYNGNTRQWSRTVTDAVMEHGLKITHTEIANPERAAELDKAATATLQADLAHSRRGIAERYQAIYAQRGWQRYGAMPEAVTNALDQPTKVIEASDGHSYTREQGRWTTPGRLWGRNPATGHMRRELDAMARSLDEPDHPDHALYQSALNAVHAMESGHGIAHGTHSERLAGALSVEARRNGMQRIDLVALTDTGDRAWAVEGDPHGVHSKRIHVDTAQAVQTPLAQSSAAMPAARQHAEQQAQLRQQQPTQRQQDRQAAQQPGPELQR